MSAYEVTLPMTIAMRSWHNDPSLPSDPLQLVPKLELGPGPGTELKHVLPWFDDNSKVLQINRWGAEGSLVHIETIIDWILEVAQQRGLSSDQITRPIATAMVQTAVKRFHKKFPDGVPSEEDDQ